jgi:hypothetical protein
MGHISSKARAYSTTLLAAVHHNRIFLADSRNDCRNDEAAFPGRLFVIENLTE